MREISYIFGDVDFSSIIQFTRVFCTYNGPTPIVLFQFVLQGINYIRSIKDDRGKIYC